MPVSTSFDRNAFRDYPLDGALLRFHPETGTHIRIENAATSDLRRLAPRVVMFGITNKCNLSCDFCSRDVRRDSAWSVQSAVDVLRGLSAAGTLEVAFGGGEPFAFRGFAELIDILHHTTPLALNVTTNGTLIRRNTFAPYAGRFGQVRVSLYDDVRWRDAGTVLSEYGQRWGANLIVDDAVLRGLPALLAELAVLGCQDVSLLSYIGPDLRRHLSPRGRAQLAAIVQNSPIACRLSVCFGDAVPVPRLFDGADGSGDCGAGLDFVSITPDRRMQGCSFHDGGLPATSAEEILHGWRNERARLGQPSARRGCARRGADACRTRSTPSVSVWQAFSGNNSGECVMVAKFETIADADAYLAQLLPSWAPDAEYSSEWKRLFKEEAVAGPRLSGGGSPRELAAIGRSVIATGYEADDLFPELRALAWKKGAYVVPDGIHAHDVFLLAAVRASSADDARDLASLTLHPAARTWLHGDVILVTLELQGDGAPGELVEIRQWLTAYAAGRPLAAELVFDDMDEAAMLSVSKRLGAEIGRTPRLALHFGSREDSSQRAVRFAQMIGEGQTDVAGTCVLVSGLERRKRLAVLAYRQGAHVCAIDGSEVRVSAYLFVPDAKPQKGRRAEPGEIDIGRVREALHRRFPRGVRIDVRAGYRRGMAFVNIVTTDPGYAFTQLEALAASFEARLSIGVREVEPLALAVRRVIADVRS
ncbi:radical SAM protein [Burkholderia lata]|uniref:Radical SAM protein n=1 Tax=Burkholderia lata (strain ATCC 17760 / DSM 23089 / LMG 22485 / NCIMB 9086 / R18194 / 383) TaxID=482957 RepID=A0A6P2GPH8_BURL3|nr:radical SAM protein [Burkholderia lata]VWB06350.1 radical SAM protein [Burkholderia lata]